MYVEGDGGAFPGGDSQVTGHTAVVPPCVCVHWVDGQEAVGRHPLPVWEHLLMERQERREKKKEDKTANRRMRKSIGET